MEKRDNGEEIFEVIKVENSLSSSPPLQVNAPRKGHVSTQREGGHVQTTERTLTSNRIVHNLVLGLAVSRAVRK